jgi:tetratricopeptide (TPR) repeat protein
MANESERLGLLLNLRRYAEGEQFAREVIGRFPGWADGYTYLALYLVHLGRGDEALGPAGEGVRHAPHSPWVHASLAWVQLKRRDYAAAQVAASESVRLDPTYAYGRSLLAEAHFRLADFRGCREVAAEGLRHDPTHESLLHWQGFADYKLLQIAPAEQAARLGLAHQPHSARLLNLLACVLQSRAEKAEWPPRRFRLHRDADAAFLDCLRADPGCQDYHDNRRSNARSCRKHLLATATITLLVPQVLLGALAAGILKVSGSVVMLLVFGLLPIFYWAESSAPFALIAPLPGRLRVPTVPLEPWEVRAGRLRWCLAAAAWLVGVGAAVMVFGRMLPGTAR